MSHTHYASDEIARRGHDLYESSIRPRVETEDNIGKLIAIDIESGDYEIGDDLLQIADQLRVRRPKAEVWTERIGYDAAIAIGGTLTRIAP
jgi:hypothetical protein